MRQAFVAWLVGRMSFIPFPHSLGSVLDQFSGILPIKTIPKLIIFHGIKAIRSSWEWWVGIG
jgi:hypothetical protein